MVVCWVSNAFAPPCTVDIEELSVPVKIDNESRGHNSSRSLSRDKKGVTTAERGSAEIQVINYHNPSQERIDP